MKAETIEILISLFNPVINLLKKFAKVLKNSKLYTYYYQLKFSYIFYRKTKKLYRLKKVCANNLKKTDAFECLFKKFCVDIKDFKNQIYASTQCSEQRTCLTEMINKLRIESIGKFISFKELYKNYRRYVKKSSDCIMYKNNSTYNEHKRQLLIVSEKFYESVIILIKPLYCLLNQEEKRKIEDILS